MNKYKLINKKTGEETLCEKVTIDEWDYYVSDEKGQIGDIVVEKYIDGTIGLEQIDTLNDIDLLLQKKVIATNNLNIDIPQILEEPSQDLIHQIAADLGYRMIPKDLEEGIKAGYKESQETHPNSDEDVIEFNVWQKSLLGSKNDHWLIEKSDKELLQLWKEQKTKTLYYEKIT